MYIVTVSCKFVSYPTTQGLIPSARYGLKNIAPDYSKRCPKKVKRLKSSNGMSRNFLQKVGHVHTENCLSDINKYLIIFVFYSKQKYNERGSNLQSYSPVPEEYKFKSVLPF